MSLLSIITTILTIAGSLGIFLYGMKLMSESLQKVAGSKMRNFFAGMTSTPFKGVISGAIITTAIQSSSATTVLTVSFVNAGLLSVMQSAGVIMGANIGTTSTAWIVSYIGFKFDLNVILLPVIGLSLPFLFSKKKKIKNWGEFVFGFALLFIGLNFLKDSLPKINENSIVIYYLTQWSQWGFISVILFLLFGMLLTILLRSSAASMVFTFIMCSHGWISFPLAIAMVIGDNIGTTLTAIIASLVANAPAKRTALIHLLFNVFGSVWAILFFKYIPDIISLLMESTGATSPFTDVNSIPVALSIFHSGFNIITTILLVSFIPWLVKITEYLIPVKKGEKKNYHLHYLETQYLSTSELSLLQARKKIAGYGKEVEKMFGLIPDVLLEKRFKKYEKLNRKLSDIEDESKRYQQEIADYLTKLSESDISHHASQRIRSMLRIIDELDNMTNVCVQMDKTIDTKNQKNIWFTQEMRDKLSVLFHQINEAFILMNEHLDGDYTRANLLPAKELEEKINILRIKYLQENTECIDKGLYNYIHGNYYAELIAQSEKLANYIYAIEETITK